MDFLAKLKDLAKLIGGELLAGIATMAVGGMLVFSGVPAGVSQRWPQSEIVVLALGLVLIVFGVVIIAWNFRQWVVRQKRLELIAWDGFNEPEVVKAYGKRLGILEYVRGIDKVTHLKYEGSWFDVLISDVEFLDRHNVGHKLQSLKVGYDEWWGKILPALAEKVQIAGNWLGIPVRFGLNDFILHSQAAERVLRPGSAEKLTYATFRLSNTVPDCPSDIKTGLWNWYLPTLSVLLLTEGATLHNVWIQPIQSIESITKYIVENSDRFLLFDDPRHATDYLVKGKVWTVFGGGAWLLPLERAHRRSLQTILPEEGGIMWVECAAMISSRGVEPALSERYIEHLLADGTQEKLSHRMAYRTCPVTSDALQKLSPEVLMSFNLHKVFNITADWRLQNNMVLRQLPKDWRHWEQCWEEVENEVKHA